MPLTANTLGVSNALSWQHLAALGVFAVVVGVVVTLGRRWRFGASEQRVGARRLRIGVGLLGLVAWGQSFVYYLLPARFAWSKSLPLELCDLAALIAPLAILTGRRTLRAVLHFWGLALCTQFLVTPVHAPGTPAFYVGWVLHAGIIGSALFDAFGLGFRPGWRDLRTGVLAACAYLAVILPFDIATGFNYGYVGASRPGPPTIVDALGAWPLRVVWIGLIAAAAMTVVMLLNAVFRRAEPGPPAPPLGQSPGRH